LFAEIDFTDEAKKTCEFKKWNMKIFIKDDEGNILKDLDYNSYNLKRVKKMEIPLIWKLDVSSCSEFPEKMEFLSRLKVV